MNQLLQVINRIGIQSGDNLLLVNKKRFVVYEAILMSFGGILWGSVCLYLNIPEKSIIPFGYVMLSIVNILLFNAFHWFRFAQGFQTGISLLLPFFFQWHLGGFYASGGVMVWALLSLAASLSYSRTRTSVFWLLTYVMLTVFTGFMDSIFRSWYPTNYSQDLSISLITLNIAIVSVLIFLLVVFYVRQNSRSHVMIQDAQQMLLKSERMAALGQLSAGIAHEINTPLGAIKSIEEEADSSYKSCLTTLFIMHERLSNEQLKRFMVLLRNHEKKLSFLSTREERQLKRTLSAELAQEGIEHADMLSKLLVQIDFYTLNKELRYFLGPDFELVVRGLHALLISQKNNLTVLTAVEKASRVVKALKMYLYVNELNVPDTYNLKENIKTVLTIYHNQIKQGIQVQLDIPEELMLTGYAEEMNQVWTNLIVNACQAMNFEGQLNISATEEKGLVHVTIQDTGCGIPGEIGNRIFEPFFSTKRIGEGSGIGLDIVKGIIEKHQGTIHFSSELNKGTTFYLKIPIELL
jgi:signal transduction histidine kinase